MHLYNELTSKMKIRCLGFGDEEWPTINAILSDCSRNDLGGIIQGSIPLKRARIFSCMRYLAQSLGALTMKDQLSMIESAMKKGNSVYDPEVLSIDQNEKCLNKLAVLFECNFQFNHVFYFASVKNGMFGKKIIGKSLIGHGADFEMDSAKEDIARPPSNDWKDNYFSCEIDSYCSDDILLGYFSERDLNAAFHKHRSTIFFGSSDSRCYKTIENLFLHEKM